MEEREGEVAEGAEEGAVVGRRGLHREDHILLGQDLDELRRLLGQHERLMPVAVLVDGERLLAVGCEGDLLDLARLDRVEEGRVRPGRGGVIAGVASRTLAGRNAACVPGAYASAPRRPQ